MADRIPILDLEPQAIMRRRSLASVVCRGLLLLVLIPLRLVAGRPLTGPRADEEWIAELELELGVRKPKDFIEQYADPRLLSWTQGVPRSERRKQAIRETFSYERLDRYERKHKPKPASPPAAAAPPASAALAPVREPLILGRDWEYVPLVDARAVSGTGWLREQRHAVWEQAKSLTEDVAAAGRGFTLSEQHTWDGLNVQLDRFDALIAQQMRRDEAAEKLQAAADARKAELGSYVQRIAEGMRKAELGSWTQVNYLNGDSVIVPATPETDAELRRRTADYERGQDEARDFLRHLGTGEQPPSAADLNWMKTEPVRGSGESSEDFAHRLGEHAVTCLCTKCDWRWE